MLDTWQIIDAGAKVLQPWYDQVDVTRKRLNLTPFKLKDPLSNEELDDVVNITENKSTSHMKRMIASLIGAKWQGIVESSGSNKLSDREAHKIESFMEANLQQADEYVLNEYGMPGLNSWLAKHACHTGLLIVQWMVHSNDDEYKIRCLPCDARWTPFVLNKWVAPVTWRSKEDLLKELEQYEKWATDDKSGLSEFTSLYPKEDGSDRLKDEDNEVRDFWDGEHGELWVEKQLVFKQRNPFRRPPFAIVWVGTGWDFKDKGYIANQSPSLISTNEGMYEQLSRQLSVDATLGFGVLHPPQEYETENPRADLPSRPATKRGMLREVGKGERTLPVPTADLNQAELASRDQINSLIEGANPSAPRAYQTPPSAIEVTTEYELLLQDLNPHKEAMQIVKAKLMRMAIEQCLLLAEDSITVGAEGRQSAFSVKDLKDPKRYAISYKLMPQNKRLDIVNEARALSAWGRFPTKYIFKDILSVEDPDGWLREMELQKAREMNPAIGIGEQAVRFAEEAEDIADGATKDLKNWESIILQHEYVMLMRQSLNPMPPGETEDLRESSRETAGNSQGLVKMLGPGRGLI